MKNTKIDNSAVVTTVAIEIHRCDSFALMVRSVRAYRAHFYLNVYKTERYVERCSVAGLGHSCVLLSIKRYTQLQIRRERRTELNSFVQWYCCWLLVLLFQSILFEKYCTKCDTGVRVSYSGLASVYRWAWLSQVVRWTTFDILYHK